MADQSTSTGTEGIDPKLAGLLCYIWIIGLVFLIISKDKFVRFHALQAVIMGVAFAVISFVLVFIPIVNFFSWILWPLYMVLVIVMMIKAYAGEKYKLPVIGDFAEKSA
ncbi:MAG: DUF4870 domain-containing protein [Patescibacteria group bacterium]|nr:DUF4870 domain-containing protein [Patescibacteria group bacterium]